MTLDIFNADDMAAPTVPLSHGVLAGGGYMSPGWSRDSHRRDHRR